MLLFLKKYKELGEYKYNESETNYESIINNDNKKSYNNCEHYYFFDKVCY